MNEDAYISERQYRLLLRRTGLGVLIVAFITYLLTLEPTASYWDCPEYIAVATGMQPGHPPGNPVWMLAARFLINFAPGPQYYAYMVNLLSAICSALTVWLLFLTTEWCARRLVLRPFRGVYSRARSLTATGAGVTAALALCWSDTFWFSAVEAEVYAFSSLCTALLVWLALLWYDRRRQPRADRWLILIAYIMGLSLGVHELNLLCLPAIALIVAFGIWSRPGWRRLTLAILISTGGIGLVLYGVIPGFIALAKVMELWMVNGMGLPFNSGLLCTWIIVMAALTAGALRLGKSRSRSGRIWRTTLWSLALFLLGFSAYGVIIIRAGANPPLNTGNPSDIFAFSNYFSREQYGKSPLIYGAPFSSQPLRQRRWVNDANGRQTADDSRYMLSSPKPVYVRGTALTPDKPRTAFATARDSIQNRKARESGHDYYALKEYTYQLTYPQELMMFFPRMHSHSPDDVEGYYNWLGATEADLYTPDSIFTVRDAAGKGMVKGVGKRPSYWQNWQYLTVYQCGFMYGRYLLWNFCGRQNDITGHGEPDAGNFITGITPIDLAMLDNTSGAPRADGSENPGHNVYYGLPLILAILGIIAQMRGKHEGRRQALVVTMLFLLTGIAIVLYLNQGPVQARDRDYAFAGSFYAFAIWIGLGAITLTRLCTRLCRNEKWGTMAGLLIAIAIPLQMLSQTADDHDRSHRTATPDMMYNMFAAMEPDAIYFAADDNSIFPAWYLQEAEGIRTDIRAISTPYLGSAWYQRQLLTPMRKSSPIPLSISIDSLPLLRSPYITLVDSCLDWTPANQALRRFYSSLPTAPAATYPRLTTPRLFITMGRDTIFIDLRKADNGSISHLCTLSSLLTVDMLSTSASSPRPRHFYWTAAAAQTTLGGQLAPYMEQIGNIAHLNPANPGLNPHKTAALTLSQYRFGGAGHPSHPYFDPVAAHQVSLLRRTILESALKLAQARPPQQADTALRLLQLCEKEIPTQTIPYEGYYDYTRHHSTEEGLIAAQAWLQLAKTQPTDKNPTAQAKGKTLLNQRANYIQALSDFQQSLRPAYRPYLSLKPEQLILARPQSDSLKNRP